MEIEIFNKDKNINIKLNNNAILFGQNSYYKTSLINTIKECFSGKNSNMKINGRQLNYKDYNFIYIDEDTDFANEFKFAKNNLFKQTIYNNIMEKINEDKLINYTNDIFNIIDEKINSLLDRKVNRNNDNSLLFNIEVPDINSIVDKFTNIYIDNNLLGSENISKSVKRKLLYQLYFWILDNSKEKDNIVLINNFDVYLSNTEIIEIINKITSLSKNNSFFILSSSNNIFEYLDLDYFNIYKVNSKKILSFDLIDEGIKRYIIRKEYYKLKDNILFENYYNENEYLITEEEINNIKLKLLNFNSDDISKILNSNSIKISNKKNKKIISEYIVCKDKEEQNLLIEISNVFID